MIKGRKVIVQDGNLEKGLRKFKKMITEDGILQEVRDRQEYVKPTIRKKLARNQAKRRWQRYMKDQTLPKKLF
jgi:small subunit ribosomal protein S21